MINFLIYVSIILLVIVLAQLVRVFEASAELKGSQPHEVTYQDHKNQARMMFAFLIAFLAFCFWQVAKYKDSLLPVAASELGAKIDWLMWFNMGMIGIVFVIINILLFYFSYKYYSRPTSVATFYPHNNKLELIWTVVPAAVLAVIIILGLRLWSDITTMPQKDTIVVELYAKQFDWTARYAGKDNVLGASNYKLIEGANALGMDSLDPNGKDDIVVRNEIHIPVGKTVEFKIHSRDVIHSAYLPHFRAQINAVPGQTTSMHVTPIFTTEEMRTKPDVIKYVSLINERRTAKGEDPYVFDYMLLCNKICGASHYNMPMTVVVDTQEQYEAWIAKQKTFYATK